MPTRSLPCQPAPYHANPLPTMPTRSLPCQPAPYYADLRTIGSEESTCAAAVETIPTPTAGCNLFVGTRCRPAGIKSSPLVE
jgi:hypothetical protein